MNFVSTRGGDVDASLSQAITQGIAPDGGLLRSHPHSAVSVDELRRKRSLAGVAATMLRPFADGDTLDPALADICDEAFDFPAPLVPLGGSEGRPACSSCFMDRRARSKISARASWRPRSNGSRAAAPAS